MSPSILISIPKKYRILIISQNCLNSFHFLKIFLLSNIEDSSHHKTYILLYESKRKKNLYSTIRNYKNLKILKTAASHDRVSINFFLAAARNRRYSTLEFSSEEYTGKAAY